jgi:hypothetical protein
MAKNNIGNTSIFVQEFPLGTPDFFADLTEDFIDSTPIRFPLKAHMIWICKS